MPFNKVVFSLLAISFLFLTPSFSQDVDELKDRLQSTTGKQRLTVLYDLTTNYRKISYDTSLLYAKEAIQVAERLNNDSLLADAHLKICPSYYFLNYSDSIQLHAYIAKEIGDRLQEPEISSYACQLLASSYEKQSNYEKALEYNALSLAGYQSFNDTIGMGAINHNLSMLHAQLGNLDLALEYAITAEKLAAITKRKVSKGLIVQSIADIYFKLGQNEKAFVQLEKAKTIFTRDSFPNRHAGLLQYIGFSHYQNSQLDSAIHYFKTALSIYESLGALGVIANTHGNLGGIYQEMKEWDRSLYHLHMSLRIKRQYSDQNPIAYDLTNLGIHFDERNMPDSAAYYYQQSLALAQEYELAYVKETVLERMSQFYEKNGQYSKALDHHKMYVEHINETKGLETQKTIAELEAQYEAEKKEREIERLELQTALQASTTRSYIIGFSALSILLLSAFGLLYYRKRKDKQMYEIQQTMLQQEKENLDQEIQFKTKQLTSHALHMVQKNKVLQELRTGIRTLEKEVKVPQKKVLQALVRRIDFNIQSDEDWETFRLYFEQTNKDFYTNLTKINSNLTSTELKLCSLIKLNLNIKETAAVMNIEPTSVKTARHRLRKKLQLQPGQDLTAFIRRVA